MRVHGHNQVFDRTEPIILFYCSTNLMGKLAKATKTQEKIEKKSNRFASKLAEATEN